MARSVRRPVLRLATGFFAALALAGLASGLTLTGWAPSARAASPACASRPLRKSRRRRHARRHHDHLGRLVLLHARVNAPSSAGNHKHNGRRGRGAHPAALGPQSPRPSQNTAPCAAPAFERSAARALQARPARAGWRSAATSLPPGIERCGFRSHRIVRVRIHRKLLSCEFLS